MTLLNEEPDRVGILVSVTTGKPLVGHVEEREVLLLLDDVADLFPLFWSRIDTGRIVSTGMEKDHALFRGCLQVCDHAIKVKPDSVLVVVLVLLNLESGVCEDRFVIRPAGSRNVDGFAMRVESFQEVTTYPQSTRARD